MKKQKLKMVKMDDIDLKTHPITTMTMIFTLDGLIHKDAALHLLPITITQTRTRPNTIKYRLPVCHPGAIISMQYKDIRRGIIKNTKKTFFKNSVTLDMSTAIKNVNIKISPNTLQLCGAASKDNGIEAADLLINHLTYIQQQMNYLKSNMEEYQKAVEWLTQHTRGESILKNGVGDFKVIKPTSKNPLLQFLIMHAEDQIYHSDYINKIKHLHHFPFVISNNLKVVKIEVAMIKHPVSYDNFKIMKINEVMVNYNYNLGFKVDRDKLNLLMSGRDGFYSHYDNALVNCVTIQLPYQQELDYKAKKKKKDIPHHTFLVYKSGAVTQSGPCSPQHPGPCGTMMEDAFLQFRKCINEIKDQIIVY
jgi:hypothetical protein